MKKKVGKKKDFNIWAIFGLIFAKSNEPISNTIGDSEYIFWLFCGYMISGMWFYCVHEGFTIVNSVYFLVSTMTTVGYGDLIPSPSAESRGWTIFFVVYGILVTMAGLTEVASYLMEMRDHMLASTRAAVLQAATSSSDGEEELNVDPEVLDKMSHLQELHHKRSSSFAEFEAELLKGSKGLPAWRRFLSFAAAAPSMARKRWPIVDVVLYVGVYCGLWGAVYSSVEKDMTFIDAVYYAMVTGTTIGYGDVSPQTATGRWLAVGFIPFAVVFISAQMGAITDVVMGNDLEGKLEGLMELDLSLEALLAMDTDGDGEIDEFEFLKFMLVKADMADGDILDSLHSRFCAMDEDGSGVLTAEDLPRVEPFGGQSHCNAHRVDVVTAKWLADLRGLPTATVLDLVEATRLRIASPVKRKKNGKKKDKKKSASSMGSADDGKKKPKKAVVDAVAPEMVPKAPMPIIIHEGTPRHPKKRGSADRVSRNSGEFFDQPIMGGMAMRGPQPPSDAPKPKPAGRNPMVKRESPPSTVAGSDQAQSPSAKRVSAAAPKAGASKGATPKARGASGSSRPRPKDKPEQFELV